MLSKYQTTTMAAIKENKSPIMTAAVSCSRLRQVQALLRDDVNTAPDGILCSLGIDSRYNEGCSELANFLFCGLYKHSHFDMEQIPDDFPEEVLDDVIILIKAESVHLYCNPVNYGYLLPYVSHWRNLQLHCLTETEYEDEEVAEEFKISSFVSMVQDCRCLGIPYSSHGHVQKFDMFMLEKWPIIQAFALEGIGAGVFFTMKYKFTDISQRLWQVYSRLDPVSLDCLLNKDLQLFERQWSCLFSSLEIESALSMQELSEAQVAEPFRTYYSHGLISSNITDKSKSRQPFALFGSHSTKEDLENYCFTFPSEGHQVRNTGPGGGVAKHMLLQCVAPKGPLACARTYFFGSTHVPYLGNDNTQQKGTDLQLLSHIYSAVVQSVLAGIKCFSISSSASKAKDVAEQTFQLALDNFGLIQYRGALRSKAVFSIQAVNNEGIIIPLSDEDSRFMVKTASMTVHDIPDLQCGENLGSVVFSESFLESRVYIQQRDGALCSDSCFTVLTSSVPRHVCWLVDEADVRMSEQAQRLLKEEDGTCLGIPLTVRDSVYMFSNSLLSTPEEGKLVFFSEGILFVHPHHGSITLSMSHINTIKLYDGGSLSDISMLFIDYQTSLLPHLPFPLHSADFCLAIGLLAKTKSYKSLYSQVLPAWRKSDSGLRVQHVLSDQLSPEHKSMYFRLLKLREINTASSNRAVLKTAYPHLPELDRFLQHFAISSSVGEESVCSDHMSTVFSDTAPEINKPECKRKMVLTIIAGLPGSHKENLCDFLMEVNQNRSWWELFCPALEGSEEFSASHLQRYLSSLLAKQTETDLNSSRVVLLVPGYTDVLDVIQAITAHPDPQVHSQVTVGAVSACINPLTSFIKHRLLFPKLLEQCSQGVVSNVVFTSLTEQKHPLLKHMQQLIRAANPSAAFISAEKGAVKRTEDIRLILNDSGFSQSHMINARYMLYPGWWEGRFVSGSGSLSMSQHCVEFSRPLERALFLQRCKALKSSIKPSPFTGNIYHISGKVLFSDNDRQMVVNCNSISGNVTIAPDQGTHHGPRTTNNCYLMFHGVGLTQEGLKDWLRHCAKQKVEKKVKKNKRTLTPQEIRYIHVKRHLDPLPPGYFYNGHHFVSFFGEKQNFHPLLDQFIDEYVQEANKEIERFNREVDLKPHADLFDP
ncbi:dynein axonemal assembly factor 9 [Carassius gibelio]|uniref:dynein axonemal assembly factor 9 n=1 Tax=Carassius gibelio TaxID=101364 RepID=UPI0022789639|nr:dynein axonemal assembly factor 9 [Carassius gibelio]